MSTSKNHKEWDGDYFRNYPHPVPRKHHTLCITSRQLRSRHCNSYLDFRRAGRSRFPSQRGARDLSLHSVQTVSGAHPAAYPIGTWRSSSPPPPRWGGKAAWSMKLNIRFSAEVKNGGAIPPLTHTSSWREIIFLPLSKDGVLYVKQPGIESWAPYMGGLYQKTRSKSRHIRTVEQSFRPSFMFDPCLMLMARIRPLLTINCLWYQGATSLHDLPTR
jgi:hypothetical protein